MSASNQLAAFNYAVQPFGNLQIKNITAAYTVVSGDAGKIINCTSGTFAVSMTASATLGVGFNCIIWNTSTVATDVITITPNGAETIDGKTTAILRRGEGVQVISDGTNLQTGNKKNMRGYAENIPVTYARASAAGSGGTAVGGASVASGQDSTAVGYTCIASGTGATASGYNANAGSDYSLALGGGANGYTAKTITGAGAIALGNSYASGVDSFSVHVQANGGTTYGAKGANSISIGQTAVASNTNAVAFGKNASATGVASLAIGPAGVVVGYGASASGENSVAVGDGAVSNLYGKYAYSQRAFGLPGEAQYGLFILIGPTTSATPLVLTTDRAAATTTNQIILPNNSAYAFTGTIIARQQAAGGSNYAAWEVKGAILRDATAASTVLGSVNINALSATAGASAWVVALSADTTNGGLAVTVTGAASVNIRWVATIKTSEVTYA